MEREIITIDGGSKQYWAELKEACRLLARVEERRRHAEHELKYSPYLGVRQDEDGEWVEIIENTVPLVGLEKAMHAVARSPTAMRILEAQGGEEFREYSFLRDRLIKQDEDEAYDKHVLMVEDWLINGNVPEGYEEADAEMRRQYALEQERKNDE